MEYPEMDEVAAAIAEGRFHSHEEVWGNLLDKLSKHYGTDMRKLVKL